jgi:hypothetical protein
MWPYVQINSYMCQNEIKPSSLEEHSIIVQVHAYHITFTSQITLQAVFSFQSKLLFIPDYELIGCCLYHLGEHYVKFLMTCTWWVSYNYNYSHIMFQSTFKNQIRDLLLCCCHYTSVGRRWTDFSKTDSACFKRFNFFFLKIKYFMCELDFYSNFFYWHVADRPRSWNSIWCVRWQRTIAWIINEKLHEILTS